MSPSEAPDRPRLREDKAALTSTWSRSVGKRAIIIIDDDWVSMEEAHNSTELAFSDGLFAVFLSASEWPLTRGVGYFSLPSRRTQADLDILIGQVSAWLNSLCQDISTLSLYFLVDYYYGVEARTMVGDYVCQAVIDKWSSSSVAFLSVSGQGTAGQLDMKTPLIRKDVGEGRIKVFDKSEVKREFKDPAKTRLPLALRTFLGHDTNARASQWTLDEWRGIRTEAWKSCLKTYEMHKAGGGKHITNPFWAHHLPDGNDCWSNAPEYQQLRKECERNLQIDLARCYLDLEQFPLSQWEKECTTAPTWERPPLRAIAQFTDDAGDLKRLLQLARTDTQTAVNGEKVDGDPEFEVSLELTVKNGYLWLNASCMARGLLELGISLRGAIRKRRDRTAKATVGWKLIEEDAGLVVRISQTLNDTVRLPLPSEATGKVLIAYQWLQKAGATITFDDDGPLFTFGRTKTVMHNRDVVTL